MIRLIFNVVFLIVIAIFIALNLPFVTTINLFGRVYEEVSVIVVIILSLVLGVVYSLVFNLVSHIATIDRERLKERAIVSRQREKELETREKYIQQVVEGRKMLPPIQEEQGTGTDPSAQRNEPGRSRFSLFRKRR